MVTYDYMDKLLILVYLALTVGGLTLVKLGTHGNALLSRVDERFVWNIGLFTILGLFCYGLSFLLLMFLVSRYELSFIIPVTTALGQVLIFIVAVTIFKEQFTVLKLAAITLIVTGVLLLQIKSGVA